jgi:predicted RNase H-like HicB family nuclease
MELTAVLTPAEEGGSIALNPETGTTTQGETVEEAIANLAEATALYLSEFPLRSKGCVVPLHSEVKVGSLAGVLRQADVSSEEFIAAL